MAPKSLIKDISKWDVQLVTDMRDMFSNATKFNQDLSKWNVSSVESMTNMFKRATSFNQSLCSWGQQKLKSSLQVTEMFVKTSFANNTDPKLKSNTQRTILLRV